MVHFENLYTFQEEWSRSRTVIIISLAWLDDFWICGSNEALNRLKTKLKAWFKIRNIRYSKHHGEMQVWYNDSENIPSNLKAFLLREFEKKIK